MKLTKAQFELLRSLTQYATIRKYWFDLSAWVDVNTGKRVTKQANKLEELGLAEHFWPEHITRYRELRITDAGRAALATAEGGVTG